jgi:hypothetical protein
MDPRRRSLLPERVLLPPAPRDPDLAARWATLPFARRRQLAVAALRGAAPTADAAPEDTELVRALARARVATGWRLQVAALVLGWLVLMTIWGFGRSTFPEHGARWQAAGLLVGGLVWALAALLARRRIHRARQATRTTPPHVP